MTIALDYGFTIFKAMEASFFLTAKKAIFPKAATAMINIMFTYGPGTNDRCQKYIELLCFTCHIEFIPIIFLDTNTRIETAIN